MKLKEFYWRSCFPEVYGLIYPEDIRKLKKHIQNHLLQFDSCVKKDMKLERVQKFEDLKKFKETSSFMIDQYNDRLGFAAFLDGFKNTYDLEIFNNGRYRKILKTYARYIFEHNIHFPRANIRLIKLAQDESLAVLCPDRASVAVFIMENFRKFSDEDVLKMYKKLNAQRKKDGSANYKTYYPLFYALYLMCRDRLPWTMRWF